MKKKKPQEKQTKSHAAHHDDDYVSLDISSATECTGMVPTPPLDEAQKEGYEDIYSVPQPKATNARKQAQTSRKRR